jgi:uncharacterized protein DUF4112
MTTRPQREGSSGAQDADWEVLPPERKGARQELEPLFRWIALIMDDLVRLPGTKFRIGIDPLIGLIPGIGDTGSALVSAVALLRAVRAGMPKIVLARMAVNILLNEIIGIIPGIGDAFSFWFKSNARNHRLVQEYSGGRRSAARSDWLFVIGVLVALVFVVGAGIFVSLFVLQQLIKLVTGQ